LKNEIRKTKITKCRASSSCDWNGSLLEYSLHYNQHFKVVLNTKIKFVPHTQNLIKINRVNIDLNKTSGICQNQLTECVFKSIGCNEFVSRENCNDHMLNFLHKHLELISLHLKSIVEDVFLKYNQINYSNQQCIILAKKDLETDCLDSSEKIREIMLEKLETLENFQKELCNDITRAKKFNEQLLSENNLLRKNLNELKIMSQNFHQISAQVQMVSYNLKERLNDLERISYDGKLLWKITRIKENGHKSKESHFSPVFYTRRDGYKLGARLDLHDDLSNRSTCLDLYLIIFKNDCDFLLKWPFSQIMNVTLKDQSEFNDDFMVALKPDLRNASFDRPTSEMNKPYGPIRMLLDKKYVKNNIFFIEIIAECNEQKQENNECSIYFSINDQKSLIEIPISSEETSQGEYSRIFFND